MIYGLCNLIFDHSKPPHGWNMGHAARLTYRVEDDVFCVIELISYHQSVASGGMKRLSDNEKGMLLSEMDDYGGIVEDETLSSTA